jgi:hypothetical protein
MKNEFLREMKMNDGAEEAERNEQKKHQWQASAAAIKDLRFHSIIQYLK